MNDIDRSLAALEIHPKKIATVSRKPATVERRRMSRDLRIASENSRLLSDHGIDIDWAEFESDAAPPASADGMGADRRGGSIIGSLAETESGGPVLGLGRWGRHREGGRRIRA